MPETSLSDSLKELETKVTDLEQRKVSLTQDISTLEARKAFTERAVKEVADKRIAAENKANAAINGLQIELTSTRNLVTTERTQIATLITKRQNLLTSLETTKNEADKIVVSLDRKLQSKKIELTTIKDDIQAEKNNLETVKTNISIALLKLSDLEDELEQEQANTARVLGELKQQEQTAREDLDTVKQAIVASGDEHKELIGKISVAKSELTELEKKHTDYVAYESRAQKALEAKEQALISREEALEDAEMRAKRRGILDNI